MAPNPVPSGLSAPAGYEIPNSLNLGVQNRWNEMDDDDDGFPVGFMLLILVVFVGLLYRKSSQNREAATTPDSSRGGYEPVAMAQRYHAE